MAPNGRRQRLHSDAATCLVSSHVWLIWRRDSGHHILPPERVRGVETGACPHSAIRDDASMNLEAIAELQMSLPNLQMVLVESGGGNLGASFSPELVDVWIYVIDVAAGDKIPRKGGPGIIRSDLLLINKIDLAPYVGASLDVMARDTKRMRGTHPYIFTNLKDGTGLSDVVAWVEEKFANPGPPMLGGKGFRG